MTISCCALVSTDRPPFSVFKCCCYHCDCLAADHTKNDSPRESGRAADPSQLGRWWVIERGNKRGAGVWWKSTTKKQPGQWWTKANERDKREAGVWWKSTTKKQPGQWWTKN
ncbi:hypothetical protein Y032_0558g3419 [Ancylostoma ceylanicum]|uniref:Uncharacterized protein n=1 Tax=Ancylostoma ceylanicum TaxID=53326 RepID=A0A016WR32_9BILA|nr:hypothetical protein Y032_0558g3419 [Ancylostoma ceylanicum]